MPQAQFMQEFGCPGCGTTGHAVWLGEAGAVRTLVELSDGFTQAPSGDPSSDARIACIKCGAIQPQQQPPATGT